MPLQSVWPLHCFLAHFFPWLTDNTHSNRTLSQMLSGMLIWLKRFHQHLQAPSSFRPCLFSFPKLYFFPSVTLVTSVRSQGNCLPSSFHSHCFFGGIFYLLKNFHIFCIFCHFLHISPLPYYVGMILIFPPWTASSPGTPHCFFCFSSSKAHFHIPQKRSRPINLFNWILCLKSFLKRLCKLGTQLSLTMSLSVSISQLYSVS